MVNSIFDRIFWSRRIFYEVKKIFLNYEFAQEFDIFFQMIWMKIDENREPYTPPNPPFLGGGYLVLATDNLGSVSNGIDILEYLHYN